MGSIGQNGVWVHAASLAPVRWANDGGITRVIADRPGQFRLSLATISADGPFSSLPGVTRHFAVVAGRVDLSIGGMLDAASPPVTFDGALAVEARVPDGPALALNLMVPTGAPALRLQRCSGGIVDDAVAVFACDPGLQCNTEQLALHDTFFPDGQVRLSGNAVVVR